MNPPQESVLLFEQLLSINRDAFNGQFYETAYHALAAAYHRSQDLGAVSQLIQVEQIATEQMMDINTDALDHPLSSQSTHTRNNQSMNKLLAIQVATSMQIITSQQQ
jgi:hypothetical protein